MKCLLIGIAGGTGSGKTTLTNRLKEKISDSMCVLYYDNYYKNRNAISIEDRNRINYDHPDAFDTELLIDHILRLKAGETIACPVYDYSKHNRTEETILIKPRKIIVVEGILVLHNKILRELFDIKIFVDAGADERIMRRAIRDINERGRSIEGVFEQYIATVKPMHSKYVEPTKAYADIILNSGLNDIALDLLETKLKSIL